MKKIMFNDRYHLTDAVLSGKKTMTRRIASSLNHPLVTDISEWCIDEKGKAYVTVTYSTGVKENVYPTYQINEEVAVALSYSALNRRGFLAPEWLDHTCEDSAGYKNKMFVRADLMPYGIRIKYIKMERLQDISEMDIMCECIMFYNFAYKMYEVYGLRGKFATRRDGFAELIDKISGKGTWDSNPWVFAYEFELIEY